MQNLQHPSWRCTRLPPVHNRTACTTSSRCASRCQQQSQFPVTTDACLKSRP